MVGGGGGGDGVDRSDEGSSSDGDGGDIVGGVTKRWTDRLVKLLPSNVARGPGWNNDLEFEIKEWSA
jgi:hypothetical protein